MSEYHKITTVFKRDPASNLRTLLVGEYALPEFAYLARNEWAFTEKVDGTNIRIIIEEGRIRFGGKTDAAMLPATLIQRLQSLLLPQEAAFQVAFPDGGVLYGEGYGAKIQKGGGNYLADGQDFALFDVRVGEWWLERGNIEAIAEQFGLACVPVIGLGTLPEMVELVRRGFASKWGAFTAEGVVARPTVELKNRAGQRVITKIKHKDFAKEETK